MSLSIGDNTVINMTDEPTCIAAEGLLFMEERRHQLGLLQSQQNQLEQYKKLVSELTQCMLHWNGMALAPYMPQTQNRALLELYGGDLGRYGEFLLPCGTC